MIDTEQKPGDFTAELIATGAIEAGSLVVVADGVVDSVAGAITGTNDSTVLGIAQDDAAIGEAVLLRRGTYLLIVDDGVTLIPGEKVYAVDNETVSDTADPGATIPAGVFLGLDPDGKAIVDTTLAPAV